MLPIPFWLELTQFYQEGNRGAVNHCVDLGIHTLHKELRGQLRGCLRTASSRLSLGDASLPKPALCEAGLGNCRVQPGYVVSIAQTQPNWTAVTCLSPNMLDMPSRPPQHAAFPFFIQVMGPSHICSTGRCPFSCVFTMGGNSAAKLGPDGKSVRTYG